MSFGNYRDFTKCKVLAVAMAVVSAGCLEQVDGGAPAIDGNVDYGDASVSLSWTPPTQNEDGSILMDLAGYNLYYGTEEGNYENVVMIDNPSISTYIVENLAPGTYYFVATSLTQSGIESRPSNTAVKVAS